MAIVETKRECAQTLGTGKMINMLLNQAMRSMRRGQFYGAAYALARAEQIALETEAPIATIVAIIKARRAAVACYR